MLLGTVLLVLASGFQLLKKVSGKWVEGHIDTKQDWAFLARFCFLSVDGQFEYLIEYDRDMGTPNLLLYYDDDNQWPAVYHSDKTCKEKEAVLNKGGQNQMIRLSHWYPDTEYSGCVVKKENKEIPAVKSTTTATTTPKPKSNQNKNSTATNNRTTTTPPQEPSYYDQFLKTTTLKPKTGDDNPNITTWYELAVEDGNVTSTELPDDSEFWESVLENDGHNNTNRLENLKDVEVLFDTTRMDKNGHKIKRSTFDFIEHYKKRRLNAESNSKSYESQASKRTEHLVVSCHNSRRFRSARERWWFIAISNCGSSKGLDVRYKFLMTNGQDSDFWHLHFSADEFYVLPILIAYTLAYVVVMIAVVMCSVELKSRHLLHSTYKLFLISIVAQHVGVIMQSLCYLRYATNGVNNDAAKVTGQFFCGISEMSFLLLLVLMAKGYTITRGRLKVGFTVKLTIFMCGYCVTYIILFVYQAKAFDPGEVLYLYESPPGYGLIVLRILAWCMFAYATLFTVKKYPEKNIFYCPFFICGTLWFYAGPLFILTANSYIDKWVRESVVISVLLFITLSGHIMFLLLTLPVFANKNFPYHVRTTQIGIMEVTGGRSIDGFGHNAYHPVNGAAQTVIIPLTRRTEEIIGNMYNQYMASAPPMSEEEAKHQPKSLTSIMPSNKLIQQDSTETNTSEDIQANITDIPTPKADMTEKDMKNDDKMEHNGKIYTIESEMADIEHQKENGLGKLVRNTSELPSVLRSRRNILDPIKKDDIAPPSWSFAKTPIIQNKSQNDNHEDSNGSTEPSKSATNGKKAPTVRNGLQPSSGEISTIHEDHIQSYKNMVSKATVDLFSIKK